MVICCGALSAWGQRAVVSADLTDLQRCGSRYREVQVVIRWSAQPTLWFRAAARLATLLSHGGIP